ncbi:MAG: putative rane protein [Subtercola sp.]|nr:putative rane protein [Subtercola sp.]
MQKKTIARAVTTATLALALAAAAPLAASAHVPVSPNQAAAGSYATLTFKVPTESATASTVKIEIDLPTDTPFGSVSYQPVAGWTTNVVTSTLATPVTTDDGTITEAPTQITYTADAGGGIAPGQFQQFVLSAGPVPDTGSVMFPVHQTYSDGTVADWVDPTPASGVEPQNPAPTLYINDAPPTEASSVPGSTGSAGVTAGPVATDVAGSGSGSGSGSDGGSAGSGSGSGEVASQGSTTTAAATTGSADAVAIGVGIGGLALGAIALIVAVLALTRSRGRATVPVAAQPDDSKGPAGE